MSGSRVGSRTTQSITRVPVGHLRTAAVRERRLGVFGRAHKEAMGRWRGSSVDCFLSGECASDCFTAPEHALLRREPSGRSESRTCTGHIIGF